MLEGQEKKRVPDHENNMCKGPVAKERLPSLRKANIASAD